MTDGHSNQVSNECGNTTQAAAALTRFAEDNSVLVYVVGVTKRVNMEELKLQLLQNLLHTWIPLTVQI